MSYQCKHCGGRHNRADTAQQCANSNRKVGGYEGEMPDASYLVTVQDSNTYELVPAMIQLRTVKGGKWHGSRIVNVYDPSGKLIGVSNPKHRSTLIECVRKGYKNGGFRKAMMGFGIETGKCPICEKPLYDEQEKIEGFHKQPKCYTELFG